MTAKSLETKIEVALDQLNRIREDIKSLDEKITRDYATKYEFEALNNRVIKLESNTTWIIRTVIGSVIIGILTMLYTVK